MTKVEFVKPFKGFIFRDSIVCGCGSSHDREYCANAIYCDGNRLKMP